MRNLGKWEQFPFRTFQSWKRQPLALPWIFHDNDTKCTTLQSGFLSIMKMMLNSRYQEKIGILCRIQDHFFLHHLYKICFLVCILFNCLMGESRTFPLTGQYLCKCIKNKQRFLHKNKVQFPQDRFTLFTLFTGSHTAPERGPITHPAEEGWPHHRGLLPLLLSIEQWCGLLYVPQELSGSAVRRDLRFTLLILGYTPEWMLFHCFGTPVSDERDDISSISDSLTE